MTADRGHVELDVLNDYVDDRLTPHERHSVSEHISSCSRCRSEHDRIVSLLEDTRDLPDSVLPPEDLWTGIRASIDRRKEIVLPTSTTSVTQGQQFQPSRPWWAYRSLMAAAAVVLVVLSSALTAVILRPTSRSAPPDVVLAPIAPNEAVAPATLPASVRDAELGYLRSIGELRSVLQAQRSVLRPETVDAVERSLSVIDAAIDEARKALLADPANETLVDLLKANYERKLDLLRRAADLGART